MTFSIVLSMPRSLLQLGRGGSGYTTIGNVSPCCLPHEEIVAPYILFVLFLAHEHVGGLGSKEPGELQRLLYAGVMATAMLGRQPHDRRRD